MRVAVIGSGGFIGSHVYEEIDNRAWTPLGYDVTVNEYVDRVLDVRTYDGYKQLVDEEPDAIINLAGVLGTTELFDAVPHAIDVNVKGQYHVAQAALDLGVPMVTIEQPHVWTNPYETTRGAGVRLARALAYHKGLRLATVRAYNAFGERQGYGGPHPQKFVPTFSVAAWQGRPMPVFGDGQQMVNAVYVKDLAKVIVEAIGHASPEAPEFLGAALVGNFKVREIAAMVRDIVGSETNVEFLPLRAGETEGVGAEATHLEIHAANKQLGYYPVFHYSDLEATVNSYKDVPFDGIHP